MCNLLKVGNPKIRSSLKVLAVVVEDFLIAQFPLYIIIKMCND
jgi:hypothetical protein